MPTKGWDTAQARAIAASLHLDHSASSSIRSTLRRLSATLKGLSVNGLQIAPASSDAARAGRCVDTALGESRRIFRQARRVLPRMIVARRFRLRTFAGLIRHAGELLSNVIAVSGISRLVSPARMASLIIDVQRIGFRTLNHSGFARPSSVIWKASFIT